MEQLRSLWPAVIVPNATPAATLNWPAVELWLGNAAVVAHGAAHELGATAYAIKPTRATDPGCEGESLDRLECRWQHERLPDAIRELVLED